MVYITAYTYDDCYGNCFFVADMKSCLEQHKTAYPAARALEEQQREQRWLGAPHCTCQKENESEKACQENIVGVILEIPSETVNRFASCHSLGGTGDLLYIPVGIEIVAVDNGYLNYCQSDTSVQQAVFVQLIVAARGIDNKSYSECCKKSQSHQWDMEMSVEGQAVIPSRVFGQMNKADNGDD